MIIGRTLKSLGFDVTEAGNGQEALDAIATHGPFVLALVDWNMPVMDGYEFVCSARRNPANREMRIMMVTTETEHTQVTRALAAGASEYLMKPFPPEAIAEKLILLGFKAAS
jgi:two-component system chemotaxis response regulator CheY